jgi:hypothetical protein
MVLRREGAGSVSKGGGSTTTTQKSDPWSGQQPYLTQGFQQAQNLYLGGANPSNTGGSGSSAGGVTPGVLAAQGAGPRTGSGNSAIQDIGQAMSAGTPITDAQWAQAGFGPGGAQLGGSATAATGGDASSGGGSIFTSGPQYFPGSTYAAPTALQNAGLNQVGGLGLFGSPTGNAAINADVQGINGSQSFFNNIASQVLPQIQGQFASGNRMDSGLATRAATSGLSDAWMKNQLNYMNQAPALNNMQMSGAQNAATAGQMQQTNNQAGINDQIQRYNYNQQLPYSNLNNYMNLIQGNYGGTSSTSQPYFNNTLGQIGSVLGGVGGLASAFPETAAAALAFL